MYRAEGLSVAYRVHLMQPLAEGTLIVPSLERRWPRLAEVTQLIISGARFGPRQFGSSLVYNHHTNHRLSTHLE